MNNRKELFVVLATAAVLATMFFSVRAGYSAAKEKARQAQCVSNLSQIGKGFFQYAMSNDDWYPTSSRTSTPKWMNGDSGASFNLLYKQNKNYRFTTFGLPSDEGPFVADPKVFLCPSKDSISVATDGQSLLGHVSYL